jgi:hypothetical protein
VGLSLSVQLSTRGGSNGDAETVVKRAIMTEVSPGLACIGDAVSTKSWYGATTKSGGSGATRAGASKSD